MQTVCLQELKGVKKVDYLMKYKKLRHKLISKQQELIPSLSHEGDNAIYH